MSEKKESKRYLFEIVVYRTSIYGEFEETKEETKPLYTMAVSFKQAKNNIRHKYKFYNQIGINYRIEYDFMLLSQKEVN